MKKLNAFYFLCSFPMNTLIEKFIQAKSYYNLVLGLIPVMSWLGEATCRPVRSFFSLGEDWMLKGGRGAEGSISHGDTRSWWLVSISSSHLTCWMSQQVYINEIFMGSFTQLIYLSFVSGLLINLHNN